MKNFSDSEKKISLISKGSSNGVEQNIIGGVKVLKNINYLGSSKSKTIILDILNEKNYKLYLRTLEDGIISDYHIESISKFPPKYRILKLELPKKQYIL